ncbi:unnamed protein product [Merluccius merluccius]
MNVSVNPEAVVQNTTKSRFTATEDSGKDDVMKRKNLAESVSANQRRDESARGALLWRVCVTSSYKVNTSGHVSQRQRVLAVQPSVLLPSDAIESSVIKCTRRRRRRQRQHTWEPTVFMRRSRSLRRRAAAQRHLVAALGGV